MQSLGASSLLVGLGTWAWRTKRVRMSSSRPWLHVSLKGKRAPKSPEGPAALGSAQGGLSLDPSAYPEVRRDEEVVDELHGRTIADPYRWLEDPDSEETKSFVEAQNKVTKSMFDQCETREPLKQLLTKLYDFERYGCPFKKGDRYYYYHNTGLQNQSVLYTQDSLDATATVLLDPNKLSDDGTVSLGATSFSESGKYMAYTLSSGGSDWKTIEVMDVTGGKPTPLADKLELVKFSCLSWTHDDKGFFYNRYKKPEKGEGELGTETDTNTDQLLCYHKLGTPQSEDVVVLALPEEPTWMLGASVTDDGAYAIISISNGCQPVNKVWVMDLTALPRDADGAIDFKPYEFTAEGHKELPLVKLVDTFDGAYSYEANDGPCMTFHTNKGAPRYRVVRVDDVNADKPKWTDVIPQHSKDVLQWVSALQGDHLLACYLHDVSSQLQLRSLATGELVEQLEMPFLGSVAGCSGSRKSTEFFFKLAGFTEPGAMYRCDVSEGLTPALFRRTLVSGFDGSKFVTKQLFAKSKDGTRVPMYVVHREGLPLDGSAPTLLYGYGGFNISLEPSFSATRAAFLTGYDGVFVSANLRGGGEYGTDWRANGSLENKQNVFDDFQACAEMLISEGYTSPSKLTIQGGSNGGLLVGACMNQRPDLYSCIIGQVGVMDMLRFHKFTIGHAWCTDFGNPDKAEEFSYIYPYSPLHNVRVPTAGPNGDAPQYPAVLLTTADHDDRVVPLHSFKLIAELQHTLVHAPESSTQNNPLCIRVDVRAGHGAGKPVSKVIDEAADIFSFAAKCMDAKWRA